jgi:hypothetical protein
MKTSSKIALSVVSVIVFIGILANCHGCDVTNGSSPKTPIRDSVTNSAKSQNVDTGVWTYSEEKNKMDGSVMYFAENDAADQLQFSAPYDGGITVSIILRNMEHKNDVVLQITKGQFMPSDLDGSIRIRFDKNKAETYYYSDAADGSSTSIFIGNSAKFIRGIKNAHNTIIEVTFFNEGKRTIEFDTHNLKWNH